LFGVDTDPSYRTVDGSHRSAEMVDPPAIFLIAPPSTRGVQSAVLRLSCTADQRVIASHVLLSLVCSRYIALHAPDRLTTFKSAIEYGLPTIRRGPLQSASKFFPFCSGRCIIMQSHRAILLQQFSKFKRNAKTIKSSAGPRRISEK
jgi:hypothetical protein